MRRALVVWEARHDNGRGDRRHRYRMDYSWAVPGAHEKRGSRPRLERSKRLAVSP